VLAVMWMYRCIFWSSFVILTSVAEIKLSVSMKSDTSHYYFLDQYLDKTNKLLDFLKQDRFLKENKKIWIHSIVLRKLCWMFLSQYCSNKEYRWKPSSLLHSLSDCWIAEPWVPLFPICCAHPWTKLENCFQRN